MQTPQPVRNAGKNQEGYGILPASLLVVTCYSGEGVCKHGGRRDEDEDSEKGKGSVHLIRSYVARTV